MPELWKNLILAKEIIKKNFFLHLIVLLFVLFNVINLSNTSLIDWDEGVFASQGKWLATAGAEGKAFNFQTPPLFQTLVATFFKLLTPKDYFLPLLSIIFSCLTIYLIFFLTTTLYSKREGIYAVIIFVTTEFFFFFSKSGLSDSTFLFFFTAAVFFFVKGIRFNKTNYFLLTGLFSALALYTKYSAFSLLVMFLLAGYLYRKDINKKWFAFSIMLPIVLFSPYLYIFIKFVQIPGISTRYIGLLGINHAKFLYYLLSLAPIPFLFSIIHIIRSLKNLKKWDILILLFSGTFFVILGFYYHYFRLAYPLVPFLSIIASRFVIQTGKYKLYVLTGSVIIALLLSLNTICYKSDVPKRLSIVVDDYSQKENIKYAYAVVPPNIYFYIKGKIAVPADHPWARIGRKFPHIYKNAKIIHRDNNELLAENKILLIHATIFDSLKQKNIALYNRGMLLHSIEFKDAPVYYKDIYNRERDVKQIYEIYLFDSKSLGAKIDNLWDLGFNRQVTVIQRPSK